MYLVSVYPTNRTKLSNLQILRTYDILDQSDFNWNKIVENMNAVFEIDEFSLGHFLGFHAVFVND